MSNKRIWMGIPRSKMQWVPAPLAGAEASNVGFTESMLFENGGADGRRSAGYHKQYQFEFNAPIKGLDGLSVFNKYASGFYGDGLIHFADPYAFETNLFPAHWASPGLIEQGWRNWAPNAPSSYTDTATNSYNQPPRTASLILGTGAGVDASSDRQVCTLVIPPGYTLHFGVSGAVTDDATAGMYYQTVAADGTLGTATQITFLDPTAATRLNTSVASSSAVAVRFFPQSTVATAVSIASMMAQLWETGITPTLTGNHVPGEGHTGLMFMDDARVETYVYINPPRKAMSTTLMEVGAWR